MSGVYLSAHRCLDVPLRNRPVFAQQPILVRRRHELESMSLVKTNRPRRICPCSHQHRPRRYLLQMFDQLTTNTTSLLPG